jgi:hypothetical protein
MTKKHTSKTEAPADTTGAVTEVTTGSAATSAADTPAQDNVQGRGAFIVEMTAAGVAVAATLVTENGRALAMPAIFPNLGYALSQIDEMRALVIRHFEQASQIGAQVIAQQLAQQQAAAQAAAASDVVEQATA